MKRKSEINIIGENLRDSLAFSDFEKEIQKVLRYTPEVFRLTLSSSFNGKDTTDSYTIIIEKLKKK